MSTATSGIDAPSRTARLDTAEAFCSVPTLFRGNIGRNGSARSRYRTWHPPSGTSPTRASVLGPRRAGVVEQDRAAAAATHDEYRLLTVPARCGEALRLTERTMPRNRHKALQVAMQVVATHPIKIGETMLSRPTSRCRRFCLGRQLIVLPRPTFAENCASSATACQLAVAWLLGATHLNQVQRRVPKVPLYRVQQSSWRTQGSNGASFARS